jgi:hypothetical protein
MLSRLALVFLSSTYIASNEVSFWWILMNSPCISKYEIGDQNHPKNWYVTFNERETNSYIWGIFLLNSMPNEVIYVLDLK